MVTLTRIYTRGGDTGQTSLGDGSRVAKHDLRVAAYGTVDETNGVVGLARLHTQGEADAMLARIQNDLFDLGADLCTPGEGRKAEGALRIVDAQVERLEREIDTMNAELAPLTSFILPGGTAASAHLHLARTVARRAERLMCDLAAKDEVNPAAIRYVNRLSDHLFVLARWENERGTRDVLWVPGGTADGSPSARQPKISVKLLAQRGVDLGQGRPRRRGRRARSPAARPGRTGRCRRSATGRGRRSARSRGS